MNLSNVRTSRRTKYKISPKVVGKTLIIILISLNIYNYTSFNLENGNDVSFPWYHSLVKMSQGGSWKSVDWSNPFSQGEEDTFKCTWTQFVSAASGNSSEMCVHTFHDGISDTIKGNKRWNDCNNLPSLWNKGIGAKNEDQEGSSVYIEIGANIGSCVMEMLLGTDANIIAFEPHPMNVYNLKKTISAMGESYRNRVLLFPIGLGDSSATSKIYSASDNMGNSVIGKVIKDFDSQKFEESLQFDVHVERLDSILRAQGMNVKLMKIDAQGFECRVFEGMGVEIAKKVEQIKFELATRWVDGQNCADLFPRIRGYGFDIYRNGLVLDEAPRGSSLVVDLLAMKSTSK